MAYPTGFHIDWLRLIRFLTQYVAPGLAAVVVVAEIIGWLLGAPVSPSVTHAYHYLLLIVFSLLTAIMIGICGWIVCLWDLDRLFFKLERGDGFYRKHNGLTISVKQAKSGSWHAAHFHGALLGPAGDRHCLRPRRKLVTPSMNNPACEARFWVLFAALPGLQRSTSFTLSFSYRRSERGGKPVSQPFVHTTRAAAKTEEREASQLSIRRRYQRSDCRRTVQRPTRPRMQ